MEFKEQYKIYLDAVEKQIADRFKVKELPQKTVLEAMRYAVCGGGKRLRPILVQAAAEICGGDADDAARVALAVECVHNYSLIHDDLPCMDDDALRRGRATCHMVYGEDMALLAGDGLLNIAFEILSDVTAFKTLGEGELISIIRCLSSASGVMGMIGGQVVDLESEERTDVTADELIYLHNHKTGALIRAAVRCGCLCGGKDCGEEVYKALDSYAQRLGLAFQIQDDILDVVGDEALLGKPIGSDAQEGKNTFVTMFGLDGAKEYLADITADAKEVLKTLGERGQFLDSLAEYLLGRKY